MALTRGRLSRTAEELCVRPALVLEKEIEIHEAMLLAVPIVVLIDVHANHKTPVPWQLCKSMKHQMNTRCGWL